MKTYYFYNLLCVYYTLLTSFLLSILGYPGETINNCKTDRECMERANQLIDSFKYKEALLYLDAVMKKNPILYTWYLKQRAICHAQMNDFRNAELDMKAVEESDPDDLDIPALRMLLKLSYRQPGSDTWRTDKEFAQKLDDPATTSRELVNLGNELFHLKEYERALAFFNKALETDSKNAEYLKERALCLAMMRRRVNEVQDDLKKVKALSPNDEKIDVYYRLALLNNAGRPNLIGSEEFEKKLESYTNSNFMPITIDEGAFDGGATVHTPKESHHPFF